MVPCSKCTYVIGVHLRLGWKCAENLFLYISFQVARTVAWVFLAHNRYLDITSTIFSSTSTMLSTSCRSASSDIIMEILVLDENHCWVVTTELLYVLSCIVKSAFLYFPMNPLTPIFYWPDPWHTMIPKITRGTHFKWRLFPAHHALKKYLICRGDWIWTSDHTPPRRVL